LADVEREHILHTLKSVAGNKAAAARVLGLNRKTLYRKLALQASR
jgi:DNA-binding NtrC family response regulator